MKIKLRMTSMISIGRNGEKGRGRCLGEARVINGWRKGEEEAGRNGSEQH